MIFWDQIMNYQPESKRLRQDNRLFDFVIQWQPPVSDFLMLLCIISNVGLMFPSFKVQTLFSVFMTMLYILYITPPYTSVVVMLPTAQKTLKLDHIPVCRFLRLESPMQSADSCALNSGTASNKNSAMQQARCQPVMRHDSMMIA